MKDYLAPMEGVTNYIYRNAYHKYFHPMDKYFTPFLSAKPNKKLSQKEIKEVSPETNSGLYVVPQILTNQAQDFTELSKILESHGHREVNLNLGCPSGTVTAKGKGSGFLSEPEKLDRFLDRIFTDTSMKISVKTRIGTDYEEDWPHLLEIYQKYPLEELIIHPRLQKDYYKNQPRLEAFAQALSVCRIPVCYNGDLFTPIACKKIYDRFPKASACMYGRGVIRNPFLLGMVRDGILPQKQTLREFHDELYAQYAGILSGDRNILFRMKELWSYLGSLFKNSEKYMKKIKKSQRCSEYQAIVSALFCEAELVQEVCNESAEI